MTGTQFGQFILGLIVVAAVVAIVVWLLNWLYLRSSKERAFVRTGFGGQKVVQNGGAFVLPIIHEVIPVNMNTLRLEVEMIRAAHEHDLLTTPYVFSAEEAGARARAGADIIVCHMGLTTGGSIGAETALTLKDCVPRVDNWAKAARAVNKDVIVLCHGGPIATPKDARYILKNCPGCNGFYGASSMERLPTERALTDTTVKFKEIAR